MVKYDVDGLDCANCANEIEKALRKEPGLESASLSFAAKALYVENPQEERIRRIIGRIEPGVTIAAADSARAKAIGGVDAKAGWAIARIAVAGILFVLGSVFHGALHATPRSWAEYAVLLGAYALIGWPVLLAAARDLIRGRVFNEMFLMSVATLGAIAIHQLPEAVGVMLFYSVGEYLQDRAAGRSRRSIAALMDLRPEFARIVEGSARRIARPEEAREGDLIEILPGERIPLDGQVIEGSSFVDASSLTGESVPRAVGAGSRVLGGFVNDEGRILVRASGEFGRSAAARVLELVEEASAHKAPTEKFISRFAAVYTPAVVGVALLMAVLPPLFLPGASFGEWIYRALVVLVVSCPCALVISIPLGYFGGIGGASREKVLVKGGNYLDALATLDTIVFDKTGTLTEGVFAVTRVETRNGFEREELLGWAAAAESRSSHPVAASIREAARAGAERAVPEDIREIKGHGVQARVGGRTVAVGNDRLMHLLGIEHADCGAEGTVAFVAVDGVYAGHILVSDRVKAKARETVSELRALGVRKITMLSGDSRAVAGKIAGELGLDGFVAELLPDGKVAELESLERDPAKRGSVAFVGDGMNDAPVLARADIGIAMGGLGSDAAIEAADAVVMDDDLSRIPAALRIARSTRAIVAQNVAFALLAKGVFIVLGAFGISGMWEAVIGDVGVSILAVLNSTRASGVHGRSHPRKGRSAEA